MICITSVFRECKQDQPALAQSSTVRVTLPSHRMGLICGYLNA